jgi:hypothetical protein
MNKKQLQQVLLALENGGYSATGTAISTITDALVQPDPSPAAWKLGFGVYLTQEQAFADVRNPDLHPIPLYTAPPVPTQSREALQALINGMTVSLDVSTGEDDSDNRYYGIVNEVMDDPASPHGVTLLVYDATPNFIPKALLVKDVPNATSEDAERLDWLMRNISGSELRRLGITTSAGCDRACIDKARKTNI